MCKPNSIQDGSGILTVLVATWNNYGPRGGKDVETVLHIDGGTTEDGHWTGLLGADRQPVPTGFKARKGEPEDLGHDARLERRPAAMKQGRHR